VAGALLAERVAVRATPRTKARYAQALRQTEQEVPSDSSL
jgi:hypothetical protein